MSDNGGDGNGDRATVALVNAKVDGIKELLRAEFTNLRERIEPITGIVADLAHQSAALENHGERIRHIEMELKLARENLETAAKLARENLATAAQLARADLEIDKKSDRDYRRERLPALIFAGVVALGSIVGVVLTQLH